MRKIILGALGVVALAIAGCGGSSHSAASPLSHKDTKSNEHAQLETQQEAVRKQEWATEKGQRIRQEIEEGMASNATKAQTAAEAQTYQCAVTRIEKQSSPAELSAGIFPQQSDADVKICLKEYAEAIK